jgi:hypothetical protein
MAETLTGIVGSCELPPDNERFPVTGIVLRPLEEWEVGFYIGATIKLILPDGRVFISRIRGQELSYAVPEGIPTAILIDDIRELENQVPVGTKMFVDEPE